MKNLIFIIGVMFSAIKGFAQPGEWVFLEVKGDKSFDIFKGTISMNLAGDSFKTTFCVPNADNPRFVSCNEIEGKLKTFKRKDNFASGDLDITLTWLYTEDGGPFKLKGTYTWINSYEAIPNGTMEEIILKTNDVMRIKRFLPGGPPNPSLQPRPARGPG